MTIDMETLRHWLDSGRPVTVLDVRPDKERQEWSIPGSLHVDAYDQLRAGKPSALDTVQIPGNAPVVTVCAMGRTSLLAADALAARGIGARSLEGGMKAWSLAWNLAEIPEVPVSHARVIQVRRTGKGCLSYVVASGAEAVVIDASVEPRVYLDLAERNGWKIVAAVDTHVHADHLSRSRALSMTTGARVLLPPQDRVSYPHQVLGEGDGIPFGAGRGLLTALHTPGHTGESICLSLAGTVLFTGDTLFLGGVGRPDLEGGREKAEQRCRQLFGSLCRILSFPPDTVILPAHSSAPVPFDGVPLLATLRQVRAATRILEQPEEQFVAAVLSRIPPAPPNMNQILEYNMQGLLPAADPADLEAGSNRCAVG
jgi:glyoxylase-like metal-dependent hydrolase (beta-lactamase superfamily II)/rhodanese-related sulfurtransferase